jgi:hypothetical protein
MRVNKMKSVRAAALGALGILTASLPYAGSAQAATGNVQFRGSIAQTNICAILVNNDGRLGVNATQRQLSSKLTGCECRCRLDHQFLHLGHCCAKLGRLACRREHQYHARVPLFGPEYFARPYIHRAPRHQPSALAYWTLAHTPHCAFDRKPHRSQQLSGWCISWRRNTSLRVGRR